MFNSMDHYYVEKATQRSKSLPHPYTTRYEFGAEAAKDGHIIVIKSQSRSYGYTLKNVVTGKTSCWYRLKSDALKRIAELRGA